MRGEQREQHEVDYGERKRRGRPATRFRASRTESREAPQQRDNEGDTARPGDGRACVVLTWLRCHPAGIIVTTWAHLGCVISGIGVVSTFGVGRECFWENVSRAGVSGTRAVTEFDVSSYPVPGGRAGPAGHDRSGAQPLDGEHENGHESRADPKRYSRAALLGVIAAREAWNDAGLRVDEPGAGVIIGSGGGGIDVGEAQYRDFFTNGGRHVTPYAHRGRHRRDGLERGCRSRWACAASATCCPPAAPVQPTRSAMRRG